jgi:hypothetical protein
MTEHHDEASLIETLGDIIEGRGVKRSRYELRWKGASLAELFRAELTRHGFLPLSVAEAEVRPGERAPAFHLDGDTAYFGWVFWEKFSDTRSRKLFGSVVRNARGDWLIQISPRQKTPVYVRLSGTVPMDIDLPSAL